MRQNAVDEMPLTKRIQQNAVIQKRIYTKGLQNKMSSCEERQLGFLFPLTLFK